MVELFMLGSGSRGNSTLVRSGSSAILIDAGLSARQLALRMQSGGYDPAALEAVILTHEHRDHTAGIRVLTGRFPTPVMANSATLTAAAPCLGDARPESIETGAEFGLGPFTIRTFAIPHDAAEPVGLTLEAEGFRLGYATDLGRVPATVLQQLTGCDLVVLESNHDPEMLRNGPYPRFVKDRIASDIGHLENGAAARTAVHLAANGTRHIILAHLSETNNTPGRARAAVSAALDEAGLEGVSVATGRQNSPLERIVL
jgi:phosphoribosyl 1,2-cyclic phosphodiesterase